MMNIKKNYNNQHIKKSNLIFNPYKNYSCDHKLIINTFKITINLYYFYIMIIYIVYILNL